MPKIVLIEPKAPNLHIFSLYPLPRLGCLILGTMMKQRGWKVEVYVEEVRKLDFRAVQSADLVGISTITSTAPRTYALADKIRGMGIPVILGGPHVTFLAEEALDHAEFVIRGEGEQALMEFSQAWESGGDYSKIANLSYRNPSGRVHNPARSFPQDLDSLPHPDLSLLKPDRRWTSGRPVIPIQTSRGCPFDCSFCSVTGMFGKKYRFRSTENVVAELKKYDCRRNIVFFYDDNFAAHRGRAKALLEAMIKEKFRFHWTAQVRADIAQDEGFVRLMKNAGCHTVFIGFESVNPRSLEEMNKRQTVAEMSRAIRVLRKQHIHIHGMFVYGFDQDDWQTIKDTVKFAKKAKLTSTQFMILTPLPGSELYEKIRSENRITFHDWTLYDAHHVVFQPARFSLFDLQKAQIFSHKKFYSLKGMILKFIKGWWADVGLAVYARKINRLWQKKNKTFLRVVALLKPKPGTKISIDYREETIL